jgi:ATP-dependent helicase/DNAse subunit B
VKDPLTDQQLDEWRAAIEQLARDFLSGRATVNPSDYPTTCEHCGLQTLCRVEENMQSADLDGSAQEADNDQ